MKNTEKLLGHLVKMMAHRGTVLEDVIYQCANFFHVTNAENTSS